jgi:hypothetical protein
VTILRGDNSLWIEGILKQQPRSTFDCDGTLWSIDTGIGFFEWELERGVVRSTEAATARAQYSDYLGGTVYESAMSGYLATMRPGRADGAVRAAVSEYVRQI